ncbi:dTDP-glucose 4,6-dehydratase 2 [Stieleria maiorica]|uniref:dTDP-glucose 4,6-dehydratase n=1 Tax=Stieleria maiorica TaxID=2795974 RepID=A0A5B9MNL2_9BACT|nr:dTDP-glucose 4,6-dehydratase [Stieleria maiorica]QEG01176.1 dTDP-glucose 4,6-dehydratase 2 [Stieleria maiorica]
MKILVTGGCGFIGSNLIRHLLSATAHRVVNVDKLTYAGNPNSLAEFADAPRYVFVRGDIADVTLMRGVFADHAPDAVMHLAAESHVDRSIDGPADFIQTNVVGTFHLLSAAGEYYQQLSGSRAESFRFLHVSTDEVYGALGAEGLFSESTAYDPHSPYAATKASSDHLARAWRTTYGLPVIVTNCSNNYGPYQFPEKLIPLMIIKAIGEQPLPVYGRGENVRDWLHVVDHASALCQVLQHGAVGHTYNIGGDCQRRNIDLVRSVCEILDELHPRQNGCHADLIRFVADRPGHDFRYAIDSTKIRGQLGWQPQHDLESGLRQTIRWYLEHRDWWQAILDGNYQLQRLGRVQSTDQT